MRRFSKVCRRSAALLSLVAFVGSSTLLPSLADAQPRRPTNGANGGGKKPKSQPQEIELDAPAAPAAGQPGAAPVDSGPPPVPGQMTPAAANAKRQFDAEQWAPASLNLYKVWKGETNDDEGNKQLAEYHLAIALYRLKLYQASYSIFSEISDRPSHLKFNDSLLWLAKLATDLPEPADIVSRVGKYNDQQIEKFNNREQHALYSQLNYLLGRYKYVNRQYADSIRLFNKVARDSAYYVRAQFFLGISSTQLRLIQPSVSAFTRVVNAVDEGSEGVEDEARMRDLAYLSIARVRYSSSFRTDAGGNQSIDEGRLNQAILYWNKIDVSSEYWLDGLFEESWAYFMAGDYSHALGNIHTIESPYFPNAYYPEAEVLKAVIYFSNCQYDDATVIVSKFQEKYQPLYNDLNGVLRRFHGDDQEEAFYKFLRQVRDHDPAANLPPRIKTVVENALSDRQLLRYLQYVQVLDDEAKRFSAQPADFKSSALGNDSKDALQLARDVAIKTAGQLARERYQRNLDELNEHLRDSAKILIDITAAQRNQLDQAIAGGQVSQQESQRNIVKPDDEHVVWPFNGEYWRDELGFYRQTITSKCGR
jgi:hypothetical protein